MNLRPLCCALVVLLAVSLSATTAIAQSSNTIAELGARINRERVSRGLIPYALSPRLTAAAQGQAADLARSGKYSHIGSDGSHVADRVARAGYGSYSWGRRVGENYAVYRDIETAMGFWMKSRAHQDNILHRVYREFGIGIAPSRYGGAVFVVDFGAQPNVLPVFIEDGAAQTADSAVMLRLSDEDVFDGAGSGIGRATLVQISNDPNFGGAVWRPFADHVQWTLAAGSGVRTVYIKYQDSRGRTTQSSDSIAVGTAQTQNVNTPVPLKTATERVTSTRTRTPSKSPTVTIRPTNTATRRPSPTETRSPTMRPTAAPTLRLTATGTSPGVARSSISIAPAAATATQTQEPTKQPTREPTLVFRPPTAIPSPLPSALPSPSASPPPAPSPMRFAALVLPTQEVKIDRNIEPAVILPQADPAAPIDPPFDPTSLVPFASGFFAVGTSVCAFAALKRLSRRI